MKDFKFHEGSNVSMSAPMEQPRYFRLCDDLNQRVLKRVASRPLCAGRRHINMLLGVLIALIIIQFKGVSAQPTDAMFSVGGNSVARADQVTYLSCNRVDKTADLPSSYVWVKDGKVIPGHTRQFLTLSSVTRQDAGYYQCGTPDSSSYGDGVHLHVFVPGDVLPKPLLEAKGFPVVGRPFSLHCYYLEGYIPSKKTTYTWYRDNVEIKGLGGDFLRFPNLTEADRGEYTCTAREGAAETTSLPSAERDVWPLVPPQVRIKPPGPVVKGVRGETLTLTCEVTRAFPGVPDDGYSWSYLPSPKGPQQRLEGNGSTLTLGPLTPEDRGQYMCQARNDQPYRTLDLSLTGHASVTVDIVYLNNLNLTPDLEVSEGDHVTLTCAVDSLPTAQLAWTIRGQEVRHVTDNMDHYVITRAACSDSGSYTCGASNTELPGRDRHATVQLLVHCMQGVSARPMTAVFSVGGNSVARAGLVTYLFCNRVDREADLPSSYAWVKDGKVIPGHTRQTLTLSNVTRQDAGYYQCGTPDSNSYGDGVHLGVFVPGDMLPKPLLEPKGWPVVGRPFSLHCYFLEGYITNHNTTYTWYKDFVKVKDQRGDSLRFPNVTKSDRGEYTCTAREGAAATTSPPSTEFDVQPLVPPQVRIKPPGPVVKGVLGETLTLTCEVTRAFPDVPVDGYSWSYLPSPIGPQQPLVGKARSVTLGPLTPEDRGQYMCQARNDELFRAQDLNLTGHTSVTVDIVYLHNLILTPDLEVNEGDRVTLTCAVGSFPTAQLAWTVRGQEVRHVTDNVDHYVITRAACSDSGSYTCGASNTELPGRDRHATVQLLVHCMHGVSARPTTARFSVGGNSFVLAGQETYLSCNPVDRETDPPSSYVWVKDGKVIPGHTRQVLTLSSVTRQDAGYYQCGTPDSSSYGDGVLLHVFGISALTKGSSFSVGGDTVARAGSRTSLSCNLLASTTIPLSTYVWVKDGKVIPGHTGVILTLSSVTRQDAGYYQCGTLGSNSYGEGVHLHVFVPGDMLPKPLLEQNRWPVVGRPFSLRCFYLEDYIPSQNTTYTWYKDSEVVEGERGDVLGFPNLTEEDKGEYVCTAREGAADTTSNPSDKLGVQPLVPPQVQIKPPGPVVKGVRGETLTLTCEVTKAFPGVPVDGYSWSYLPSPKDQQRQLEGKVMTLTLGPLTLQDRGQYVCQARNDQSYKDRNLTGQASVTVDVVYLENLTLPTYLEVSEGDRVTLTCEVDSYPTAQLAWTVRGQEVRHVTDNLDHYVITRAACSDSRNYTCGASNTELPGRDRHATVQLLVRCVQEFRRETPQENHPSPVWTVVVACLVVLVLCIGIVTGTFLKRKHYHQKKTRDNALIERECSDENP